MKLIGEVGDYVLHSDIKKQARSQEGGNV